MALTLEEKVSWLERVELFRGCPSESLRRVAEVAGEIEFPAGHHIVQQGYVGNGLYMIVAGRVRIVRGDEMLAVLGSGEFFGELAVIDQEPRLASAIAEEPTTCLALASWDLIATLEEDPQLALNLLRELAKRLRACADQLTH